MGATNQDIEAEISRIERKRKPTSTDNEIKKILKKELCSRRRALKRSNCVVVRTKAGRWRDVETGEYVKKPSAKKKKKT